MSEAFCISGQSAYQISSRLGVPFRGAEVASRHNRHQCTEQLYHLQMGECFRVSTLMLIHSFTLSLFLFPAHTCVITPHIPHKVLHVLGTRCCLGLRYCLPPCLPCPLSCATLHLSRLVSPSRLA